MEYELTAKEIKEIAEIGLDRKCINETLKIALNYHSNAQNNLRKKERAWWEKMGDKHGFDPEEKNYTAKHRHGGVYIVEKKAKEE